MYFGNFTVYSMIKRIIGQESALVVKEVKFFPSAFGTISASQVSDPEPVVRLYFDDLGSSAMLWLAKYLVEVRKQAELFFFLNKEWPVLNLAIHLEQFPFQDFSQEFGLKPELKAVLGHVDFTVLVEKEIFPQDEVMGQLWDEGCKNFSVAIGQFNPQNMRVIKDDIALLPTHPAEIISQVC